MAEPMNDSELADTLAILCDFAEDHGWPAPGLEDLRKLVVRLRKLHEIQKEPEQWRDFFERHRSAGRSRRVREDLDLTVTAVPPASAFIRPATEADESLLVCLECDARFTLTPQLQAGTPCPGCRRPLWLLCTECRERPAAPDAHRCFRCLSAWISDADERAEIERRANIDAAIRRLEGETTAERARAERVRAGGAPGADCPLAAVATPNLPPPAGHADCGCAGEESPSR